MKDLAAADAAAWWQRVEQRCAETQRELAELARARPRSAHIVNTLRWRRAARLPVLVRAVPGFGDLWAQHAPTEAVERLGDQVYVTPSCGQRVLLPVEEVVICPDDCGRWMLRLRDGSVRVKAWPRPVAA